MFRLRRKKGSLIGLGAVLGLALVILGLGFLFLSMSMGGQRETKNAVDAGTLNIGRKVLDDISVNLGLAPNERIFDDVTSDSTDNRQSTDGKITLRRINRVWGKALLIGINADAAKNDGNAGSASGNADQAFDGAEQISDELADKLKTPSNLFDFFNDFAQRNSVRMIGLGVSVKNLRGRNWQTSLMDREDESNIVMNGGPPSFNLPPGYNLDPDYTTQCTRKPIPPSGASFWFLRGYKPLNVAGHTFWQVPFHYDEKPHLVSRTKFDADKTDATPLSWGKAVPNSFSAEGEAIKPASGGQRAISWVLTNPRQPYQLSIPHSFLHIHVDEMKTHWKFFPLGFPVEFGRTQTYGYSPTTQTGPTMPFGGVLCTSVSPKPVTVGLDVVGRTLDGIVFGQPNGDAAIVEGYMVNRINEMVSKPGKSYNVSGLHSVLNNPLTIGWLLAGERDFYVFSPDGENLTVQPKLAAIGMAPWLALIISNTPDGTEKKIVDDTWVPAPIFFIPTVVPLPFCTPIVQYGWGTWDKDVYWTPGSGYNECLGQIRVKRWTEVFSLGICAPPI